jgi:hypothetical protein
MRSEIRVLAQVRKLFEFTQRSIAWWCTAFFRPWLPLDRGEGMGFMTIARCLSFFAVTLVSAWICGGCKSNKAPHASTEVAALALNASPKMGDFVLEAQNSIRLQTGGVVIVGGDMGARGTGSGPFLSGGVAIDLSTGVSATTTRNVIADSVRLGTGAISCDDGNGCTKSDTCSNGTCIGTNPVVCTALDQCHTVGMCEKTTGLCSNPAKIDGIACNDSNACTRSDTCQAGTCAGGNPVICTASNQCHDAGTCNPSNGTCSNPTKPNGATCNDGNACTRTDSCTNGNCVGGNTVACTALDQCHTAGTCSPTTGLCSNPAKSNGTACNDGNGCTKTDTCQGKL